VCPLARRASAPSWRPRFWPRPPPVPTVSGHRGFSTLPPCRSSLSSVEFSDGKPSPSRLHCSTPCSLYFPLCSTPLLIAAPLHRAAAGKRLLEWPKVAAASHSLLWAPTHQGSSRRATAEFPPATKHSTMVGPLWPPSGLVSTSLSTTATGSTSPASASSPASAPRPPHRCSSAPIVHRYEPLQWWAPCALFHLSELHTPPPCSRPLPCLAWSPAPPPSHHGASPSPVSPVGWQPNQNGPSKGWPKWTVTHVIFKWINLNLFQILVQTQWSS
jgi:hypothetical protein